MSATDNKCHIKNEQQISVFSMFDLQESFPTRSRPYRITINITPRLEELFRILNKLTKFYLSHSDFVPYFTFVV